MSDQSKKPSPTVADRWAHWREGNRDVTREIAAAQKVIDRHLLLRNGPCSPTVH